MAKRKEQIQLIYSLQDTAEYKSAKLGGSLSSLEYFFKDELERGSRYYNNLLSTVVPQDEHVGVNLHKHIKSYRERFLMGWEKEAWQKKGRPRTLGSPQQEKQFLDNEFDAAKVDSIPTRLLASSDALDDILPEGKSVCSQTMRRAVDRTEGYKRTKSQAMDDARYTASNIRLVVEEVEHMSILKYVSILCPHRIISLDEYVSSFPKKTGIDTRLRDTTTRRDVDTDDDRVTKRDKTGS
eukprot:TRINITY_DN2984_c0_g1_i1.p1 TRINITY_DN2984_c0_g1~~TRINITY_DN2984_c0_g1_i1.p1  ORF type:complete len:247 (-),score=58.51 TRINITY_DN2984_c0_g1_i1:366-1082(-)